HGDVDVVTGKGAGADLDALLQCFITHVGAPVPGGYGNVHLEVVRTDTHAFRAVEHQRADVGSVQIVVTHRCAAGFVDLVLGEGDLHAHDVGRLEQAVGVRLQTENGRTFVGVVGAHTFKYAHTVMQ